MTLPYRGRCAGISQRSCSPPAPRSCAALEARGRERAQSLARIFSDRADRDADAIAEVLSELKRTIEDRLTPKEEPQLTLWTR